LPIDAARIWPVEAQQAMANLLLNPL
jgi:hypothetical protein